MEAAASAIAVVQLTTKVLHLTVKYYFEVRDARKDIKWLESEVNDLQAVLRKMIDVLDDSNDPKAAERLPAFSLLLGKDGPMERCQTELVELATKLEKAAYGRKHSDPQNHTSMRQFGVRAMKWPFTSKEIQSSITVLERCKSSFNLALTADQAQLALDTNRLVIDLGNTLSVSRDDQQKGEHRTKIIQWLSAVEPGITWSNHEDARKKHLSGTGNWLIKHPAFKQWKSARGSVLWLYGKPGCGKTVLSSSVIEHLQGECSTEADVPLSYFYFDFGTPAKQSVANCVRYILSRLAARITDVPDDLKDLYVKKCNYGNDTPALSDLIAILKIFAEHKEFKDIFLAIDALDECPTGNRPELLSLLETISSWSASKVHLFITSRPESDIRESLGSISAIARLPIQGEAIAQDITFHIQTQLSCDSNLRKLPMKLKSEIERKLLEDSDEMFRWVDCQLNELKRCKTKALLMETLKSLPKTLDSTYERILANIPPEYQDYARRALWWLVEAWRPLSTDEVAEAAVLDPDLETHFDPEARFFNPHDDVLEILGSLVSVSQREYFLEDPDGDARSVTTATTATSLSGWSSELRLSHFSVKEYLVSTRLLQCPDPLIRKFHVSRDLSNSFILQSCLEYIFHYSESDTRAATEADLLEFPLLRYACEFWPSYERLIPCEQATEDLLESLFDNESKLQAWLLVYTPDQPKKPLFQPPEEPGQALHYACYLGVADVVRHLLQNGAPVNAVTESGVTPLYMAASRGHLEVVSLLLEFGANIDIPTRGGRTPLQGASIRGHVPVVEALLSSNASLEAKDVDGWTSLYWAAESQHPDLVRFLLDRGADPNVRTSSNGTALHQVCGRGYLDIVQILLGGGAEVNVATTWGRTPLHQGAAAGASKIVQLLIDHGADPNVMDKSHSPPLFLAEENQHEGAVSILRPLTKLKDPFDSGNED